MPSTTTTTQSLPRHDRTLPEIAKHDSIQAESNLQPDVLEGSPPTGNLDLMPSTSNTRRHAVTLDSRYRRRSHSRTQPTNPYHTPPRSALGQRHRSASHGVDSLLYSSLTRNLSIEYPLASAGPPPDIAPESVRRTTGTATPPDITSSPTNTWQAML